MSDEYHGCDPIQMGEPPRTVWCGEGPSGWHFEIRHRHNDSCPVKVAGQALAHPSGSEDEE